MNDVYSSLYGNPSSLHKIGSDAEKVLHNAREIIAKTLGAEEDEIYFTSGGTESNNWAIKGTSRANRKRGSHIITSAIEHPSVLESFSHLETEGFSSEILEVGADGLLDPKRIGSKVNDETILASFILVNNETGAIQKADELIHAIRYRNPKTIIHVDATSLREDPCQSVKTEICFPSHTDLALRAVGLYIERIRIHPIIMVEAARFGFGNRKPIWVCPTEIIHQHMEQNRKRRKVTLLYRGFDIFSQCQYSINSPEDGYEGILNISFPRVKAQVLMHHLEAENIIVSVGSACSSRKNAYSHVLKAMKLPKENIEGAIRLSFSGTNTQEEAIRFLEAIRKIVPAIRY